MAVAGDAAAGGVTCAGSDPGDAGFESEEFRPFLFFSEFSLRNNAGAESALFLQALTGWA